MTKAIHQVRVTDRFALWYTEASPLSQNSGTDLLFLLQTSPFAPPYRSELRRTQYLRLHASLSLAFSSNSTVGMTHLRSCGSYGGREDASKATPTFIGIYHSGDDRLRQRDSMLFESRSGMATVPDTHLLQNLIAESNFMAKVRNIANGALVPTFA